MLNINSFPDSNHVRNSRHARIPSKSRTPENIKTLKMPVKCPVSDLNLSIEKEVSEKQRQIHKKYEKIA